MVMNYWTKVVPKTEQNLKILQNWYSVPTLQFKTSKTELYVHTDIFGISINKCKQKASIWLKKKGSSGIRLVGTVRVKFMFTSPERRRRRRVGGLIVFVEAHIKCRVISVNYAVLSPRQLWLSDLYCWWNYHCPHSVCVQGRLLTCVCLGASVVFRAKSRLFTASLTVISLSAPPLGIITIPPECWWKHSLFLLHFVWLIGHLQ